jgi:hypothetical protein
MGSLAELARDRRDQKWLIDHPMITLIAQSPVPRTRTRRGPSRSGNVKVLERQARMNLEDHFVNRLA